MYLQLFYQASFRDGVFRIPAAQRSDEAEYNCTATNPHGTNAARTILYVRGMLTLSRVKMTFA